MTFFHMIVILYLALYAAAFPLTSYVVHQKRSPSSRLFKREALIDKQIIIPLSIGLTQKNIENGHDYLLDVSDPESSNFGKQWTAEQLVETFSAAEESVASVTKWVVEHGITNERLQLSASRSWLRMNITVQEAEHLLKTEYSVFEHIETGKRSLGCDEYSIPSNIQDHVDYITPTINPGGLQLARSTSKTPRFSRPAAPVVKSAVGIPPPLLPDAHQGTLASSDSGVSPLSWDLSNCANSVTRACLQALYNMPNGTLNMSSYAVVEYYDYTFSTSDLAKYLNNLVTAENPFDPVSIHLIPGATFSNRSSDEGNLDTQLALGLVYPQTLSYYQVPNNGNFMEALLGATPRASVISISWGSGPEYNMAESMRQCNEYMQLGLLGITVLYSSGDNGVGSGTCTKFLPEFPASCPYVTVVGATQIPAGGDTKTPEVAANSFFSGGGFSNIFPQPSYQNSAISTYYQKYPPPYTSAQYNNSGNARGYPDIAANGVNILSINNGQWVLNFGTSASAPIVGGLITLINEQRVKAGKSTVGFINPVLYANPNAVNDITVGSNPGCGTTGFAAVPGWDPVTGLGTPDYKKLLKVWMALP